MTKRTALEALEDELGATRKSLETAKARHLLAEQRAAAALDRATVARRRVDAAYQAIGRLELAIDALINAEVPEAES